MRKLRFGEALFVICLLLLAAPQSSWSSGRVAVFEHDGHTYEWSELYAEDEWADIVDGEPLMSQPGDGDVLFKGQAWCKALMGEDGWFIPNFDEAIAARSAGILEDMEHPGMCGPISYSGVVQLWTSTTCGETDWYHRRAVAIHCADLMVDDRYAQDIASCTEPGWCCWHKEHYYGHHWCPLARCVRIIDEMPSEMFRINFPLVLRRVTGR